MAGLVGVIPAAGRGSRAYPYTRFIPKAMLDVCGRSVLHYTLTIMRDQLGIRDCAIVLGQHGDSIRRCFGDGDNYSMRLRYVQNDRLDLGLAHSVRLARQHVPGQHFVVMLSDELYWNSNHAELLACGYEGHAATIVTRANSTNKEIRKNFSVELRNGSIHRLIEKPKSSENGLLGCGTYVFSRELFALLEARFQRGAPDAGDLTAAINELIASGRPVQTFALTGDYININHQEDVHYARSIVRRSRLASARVSLVMPCEGSPHLIEDMLRVTHRQSRVDEVILIASRHDPTIARHAAQYGARLVIALGGEKLPLGGVLRLGIAHAHGDIVALIMDDESFDVADIDKLLAYLGEADMVVGTRTTSQLVQQGSNLSWMAWLANYFLAKLIQLLWVRRRVRLTDVSCTFRAFWRETYDQMADDVRSRGLTFLPELVIEALRRRLWVIEVPINYCRATEESHVRIEHRNFGVFLSMLGMIFSKRVRRETSGATPGCAQAPASATGSGGASPPAPRTEPK
jgi:dTDP-glucose pyrophosphorylase